MPLSDAEVETVTRKVLLQKKPTAVADVRALLDKHAGEVVDRPVTFGDVHATLLHNLGIDPHLAIPDAQGRLQRPVSPASHPLAELIAY